MQGPTTLKLWREVTYNLEAMMEKFFSLKLHALTYLWPVIELLEEKKKKLNKKTHKHVKKLHNYNKKKYKSV